MSDKDENKQEVEEVQDESTESVDQEAQPEEAQKSEKEAEKPAEKATESSDEAEKPSKTEEKPTKTEGRWYVVHTQSGFEAKSKESLEQRIISLGLKNKIFEIIVPLRDVVTIKKGKKRAAKEKVFPGYILVRMILDNDSWLAVRTTQGITGFVGAGTKPTPISEKEVQAIMKFVKQEQPKFKAQFSIGEAVKVTDGPFSDMIGTIQNMDEDKGKVTVLVSIFGRETPVELDFLQVNKL